MTYRSKIIVTAALLVALGGLGAADVYWSNDNQLAADITKQPTIEPSDDIPAPQTGTTDTTPGQGVAKRQAPDVGILLTNAGFETAASADKSMLEQIAGTGSNAVKELAILKDGDRIGTVIWMDSADVKDNFLSLKDALLASFSSKVKDLEDATLANPGQPVINKLTFLDPGLSEERLTFIRVGERLMEFHIAKDKENDVQGAIDVLSTL